MSGLITLDGVMQAPGGADEDREGGLEHGGWSAAYWDDRMGDLVDDLTWQNSSLIRGDVAEAVAKLKEEAGDEIQVTGRGELVHTLIERDLVDEYRLWVFPLVLGQGKRLFDRGTLPGALTLVDTQISTTGVAMHTYERAGEIECGSFELE